MYFHKLAPILLVGIIFLSGCLSQEAPTSSPNTTTTSESTTPTTTIPKKSEQSTVTGDVLNVSINKVTKKLTIENNEKVIQYSFELYYTNIGDSTIYWVEGLTLSNFWDYINPEDILRIEDDLGNKYILTGSISQPIERILYTKSSGRITDTDSIWFNVNNIKNSASKVIVTFNPGYMKSNGRNLDKIYQLSINLNDIECVSKSPCKLS